jgi:hypothetical protein
MITGAYNNETEMNIFIQMLLYDLARFFKPGPHARIRYLTASDLVCPKVTCGRHGEQSGKRAGRV